MNRLAFVLLFSITAACASTSKETHEEQAQAAHAEFDHIKSLEGEWSGRAAHGESEVSRVDVNYHITAGGSAVVETLFPNTEHEMVTVYHLDGDNLVLTHYCVMGNQPHMAATPYSAPTNGPLVIGFNCSGVSNSASEGDMHMHSAEITFLDKDHIETKWRMFKDEKQINEATFDLVRQESYH